MPTKKIQINRAPVMTLWATVVAERLGYDPEAALSLGKAVAGLNAQSKGRRLGIYKAASEPGGGEKKPKAPEPTFVNLLGRPVPTLSTKGGIRAAIRGEPIEPRPVQEYLAKKFGADLAAVREAMEALAQSFDPKALEAQAFPLYEKFRPQIPEGTRGWGAAGELDLGQLRRLAKRKQ
ncbi:MAG: hypothetical protein ACRDHG_01440 [Anaerolineales bacterium]